MKPVNYSVGESWMSRDQKAAIIAADTPNVAESFFSSVRLKPVANMFADGRRRKVETVKQRILGANK